MSARAIGTATVSFGLVSIPVKLYSSGEPGQKIGFNLIHKDCGSRLKQQYICPQDSEKVEREDMVKGYEFSKGRYVLFNNEELKAIEEKSTQSIEITEFVPAEQVERIYLDKVYYLGPDKGGERPYRLLCRALRETGRAAIGKYAARGKGYLVMVRPYGDGLVLEQLKYADEVKAFEEVPLGEGEVKPEELQLAKQLVEQAASDHFRPENYSDEVRARILELIQRKVDGEDITVAPSEEPQTQIIDIMEALKASLAGGQAAATGPKGARRAAKKAGPKKETGKAIRKKASA
ncbi:MAG: Ku protein [Gemmatimonadetes bacterium]|nr:Ku protein [Gemmatimonadota bacterium]